MVADFLSRKPLAQVERDELEDEIIAYMQAVKASLPITDHRLQEVIEAQNNDDVCRLIKRYCNQGWPTKEQVDYRCKLYWQHRDDLADEDEDGIKNCNSSCVTIGHTQEDTIQGHLSLVKSHARARGIVWWPGLNTN